MLSHAPTLSARLREAGVRLGVARCQAAVAANGTASADDGARDGNATTADDGGGAGGAGERRRDDDDDDDAVDCAAEGVTFLPDVRVYGAGRSGGRGASLLSETFVRVRLATVTRRWFRRPFFTRRHVTSSRVAARSAVRFRFVAVTRWWFRRRPFLTRRRVLSRRVAARRAVRRAARRRDRARGAI